MHTMSDLKLHNYFSMTFVLIIILISSVHSAVIIVPTNSYSNEDYTTTSVPEAEITIELSTQSVAELGDDEETTTAAPKGHSHATSNTTAILVGILFAMTMIVKGFPVVVAYAMTYCNSKEQKAEKSNNNEAAPDSNKKEKDEQGDKSPAAGVEVILITDIQAAQDSPISSDNNTKEKLQFQEEHREDIHLSDCVYCKRL